MTDITKQLLIIAGNINLRPEESELCADAAEEIERLRSRVADLEAAFDAAKGCIARGTIEREALERRAEVLEAENAGLRIRVEKTIEQEQQALQQRVIAGEGLRASADLSRWRGAFTVKDDDAE